MDLKVEPILSRTIFSLTTSRSNIQRWISRCADHSCHQCSLAIHHPLLFPPQSSLYLCIGKLFSHTITHDILLHYCAIMIPRLCPDHTVGESRFGWRGGPLCIVSAVFL